MAAVRILSIDPGTTAMGYAVSIFDTASRIFTVLESGAYYPSKTALRNNRVDDKHFGHRIINVEYIRKSYRKLVRESRPDLCATEDAFFNHRSPNAFALLSICIYTMSAILYEMFKAGEITREKAYLYKYAPKLIKRCISSDGTADKNDVIAAIRAHDDIVILEGENINKDVEVSHVADAIACGYTCAQARFGGLSGTEVPSLKKK